jgi:L-histidine N-alpha-methyltransferase
MFDAAVVDQDVAGIALAGLSAADKSLPPKLFYDAEGVRLFDAITRLPEYYLTRTERALLVRIAPRIAALVPPGACLVEYGASDEAKARLLFRAAGHRITAYVPIDVAGPALAAMARRLRRTARGLHVHPLCADFTRPLALPESVREARKLGFFPGSTIGNLEPAEAHQFLVGARATLGAGSWLVVGVDVRKDPSLLLPAYNDSARVTEAFNLNLLVRLNREAAASFDTVQFEHRAIWNDAESRIEMHLISRARQTVYVAGQPIRFEAGESIHTENSYKHAIAAFQALATEAGWHPAQVWTDPDGLFSIHALRS